MVAFTRTTIHTRLIYILQISKNVPILILNTVVTSRITGSAMNSREATDVSARKDLTKLVMCVKVCFTRVVLSLCLLVQFQYVFIHCGMQLVYLVMPYTFRCR